MNPLALLLFAAAAGGGRIPGLRGAMPGSGAPANLDSLLSQLQGAVNTLEKVSELSRIGTNFSAPAPRQVPQSAHIPAPALETEIPSEDENISLPAPAQSAPQLPNIDLQSAMQTLGPLLSMLSGNQNSK